MKTITIEAPEGFEIDSLDKQTDKKTVIVSFKEKLKEVTERIKSIADAVRELGEKDDEVITYRLLLRFLPACSPTVRHQEAIIFIKALNEGWVPDWNNTNQVKYYAFFEMGGSSGFRYYGYDFWASASDVGSRLALKSAKLAEYAGKQITSVYKGFMII